jgi:hypothetical protein
MNKKIIGIFVCVMFFGASVTSVLSENVNKKIIVDNILYFNNAPEEEWNQTFGGSWIDSCFSVQQTTDGGYILTGYTGSFGAGADDVWLIKTDSNGDEEWNQTFGGTYNDGGSCVQQTTDGGYIVIGYTITHDGSNVDVWLIKIGSTGYEEWNKTFGGTSEDRGREILQTTDGGFIITGFTKSFGTGNPDIWLIKTDSDGNEQWNKRFGTLTYHEEPYSIQQTSDDGFIITGFANYDGSVGADVWLIKTDSEGDEEWNQTFGGTAIDYGNSVQETTDGGYIITGATDSYGAGVRDVWLIKTNSNGIEEWSHTFGGTELDYGMCVQQTNDEGYIIVGLTESFGAGSNDCWLIKTDSNGDEEWSQTYGGVPSDWGSDIQLTNDGGYIITGSTFSYGAGFLDAWLIKIAGENQPPESPTINGPNSGSSKKALNFIFNSVDPDGDDVRFHIDWGDGNSESTSFVPSGTDKSAGHIWSETGTFVIIASAEDTFGNLGSSTTFSVVIPRNKETKNVFLQRLMELFFVFFSFGK